MTFIPFSRITLNAYTNTFSSTSANCDKARDNAVCSSALPNMAADLAKAPVFCASSVKQQDKMLTGSVKQIDDKMS